MNYYNLWAKEGYFDHKMRPIIYPEAAGINQTV